MTTKTLITPSLHEFALLLQEAVQEGWEMNQDGATTWGICYETTMVRSEENVADAVLQVAPKKTAGRPPKNERH